MTVHDDLKTWVEEERPEKLARLYATADHTRREHVGDAVHLRALVEISNYCHNSCHYCGLRVERQTPRYRMTHDEILDCAVRADALGMGTIVLQSGEDPALVPEEMADLVADIKVRTRLAITLSLGERAPWDLALWRQAGADRYLIKFETSNARLFRDIHTGARGSPTAWNPRFHILHALRSLGYSIGSGVMVGLPGTTTDDLVEDLLTFHRMDLDMIGVGPFSPHTGTPMGSAAIESLEVRIRRTLIAMALTRLLCPRAAMPCTSALGVLDPEEGLEKGLAVGANVIMPDFTPRKYRELYDIYPGKGQIPAQAGDGSQALEALVRRILATGRTVGTGRGDPVPGILAESRAQPYLPLTY